MSKISTAELAAIALGNNGQNYDCFGIFDEYHWIDRPEGRLYLFEDDTAILDCHGGGWDVATLCRECGTWRWENTDECPECRQ